MMKFRIVLITATIFLVSCNSGRGDNASKTFSFEMTFTYPGSPEFVYDHLTGDISPWWDHSFSAKPYRLFIDAKPGGGFYEIFDESGDGAKHATVIYAKRGEMLRMEGPLGLSGLALTMICSCSLKASGDDSTILKLDVSGAGEFDKEVPELVQDVWEHFLWERFKPYIEEHYRSSH